MKRSIAIAAALGTFLVPSVVTAQSAPAQTDIDDDDDDDGDAGLWGLFGLLGLAGLAGLKRPKRVVEHNVVVPPASGGTTYPTNRP